MGKGGCNPRTDSTSIHTQTEDQRWEDEYVIQSHRGLPDPLSNVAQRHKDDLHWNTGNRDVHKSVAAVLLQIPWRGLRVRHYA